MGSIINEEMLYDCSTPEFFCFSLRCTQCGKNWKSKPVYFSKAGTEPTTDEKRLIYETLYMKEKKYALMRAVEEAESVFNVCPICNRIVCDHCFMVCDELDMCVSCADRLKEKGELVAVEDLKDEGMNEGGKKDEKE